MTLLEELRWRGLVYDVINEEELEKLLEERPVTLYCGFDPTADSLHIGSLVPIITLMRFHRAGHRIIALTGSGTGLVGDPTGRKDERGLNDVKTVHSWGEIFKKQFAQFINFDDKTAFCLDNYDWLGDLKALEMWRDYGRHFNINIMLSKETVKSRLEDGLTYLEFSYMVMQSIDFLKMYQNPKLNCQLQIGGQDQWGNITSGVDLIRKVEGHEAKVFGLTMPLILKSDGTKFGKTETGTVWLDPKKTTPYEMYQFFLNTADTDVINFLKYYTFLSKEEIENLEGEMQDAPHLRVAQKALAKEIVSLVHGENAYLQANKLSEVLFSGNIKELNSEEIGIGFKDVPSLELESNLNIIEVLVNVGAAVSKREAREFLKNGAITVNGEIIKDFDFIINKDDAIDKEFTVIRRGKKNYYLIKH